MSICELLTRVDSVRFLLEGYPFKPYSQYLDRFGPLAISENMIHGLGQRLNSKDSVAIQAKDRAETLGFAVWTRLELEGEQFGFPAARIDHLIASGGYQEQRHVKNSLLDDLEARLRSAKIQHVSLRVDARDFSSIHALENRGFNLVDGLITYGRDLCRGTWPLLADAGFAIRSAQPADMAEIRELAGSAFSFDRLHADPRIPKSSADQIHVVWLENSIKSPSDQVLVAVDESGLLGYSVFKENGATTQFFGESLGTWVIAATAERARGKGVARFLCFAMFDWFLDRQIHIVEGGTQLANVGSARLHESCGFRVVGTSLSFSKWLGCDE